MRILCNQPRKKLVFFLLNKKIASCFQNSLNMPVWKLAKNCANLSSLITLCVVAESIQAIFNESIFEKRFSGPHIVIAVKSVTVQFATLCYCTLFAKIDRILRTPTTFFEFAVIAHKRISFLLWTSKDFTTVNVKRRCTLIVIYGQTDLWLTDDSAT